MPTSDRLAGTTFDSLQAMMGAYAAEAVQAARRDHGIKLDYSDASVAQLESLLASLDSIPEDQAEYTTKLWGSYFGEILRRRYGAEWIMSVYPGSDLAVPTLEIRGSRLYPLSKIHRRLTLGEAENLTTFYSMATKRLGEPVKLH